MSHISNKPIHLNFRHSKNADGMELTAVTGPLVSSNDYENLTSNDDNDDNDNDDNDENSSIDSSFKNDNVTIDSNTNTLDTNYITCTSKTNTINRNNLTLNKTKKNKQRSKIVNVQNRNKSDNVHNTQMFANINDEKDNHNDNDSDNDDDGNSAIHFSSDFESSNDDVDDAKANLSDNDDDDDDDSENISDNFLIDKLLNTSGSDDGKKIDISGTANMKANDFDKESKEIRGRPSACVFVASLSSNISDDVLCQSVTNHFKQWGNITLVKVLRDPANRPYAFVQYATDEEADNAIVEGQHSILNGRTVRCEKARVNRTLYLELKNSVISKKIMKKLLSRFGEVERLIAVNDDFNPIKKSNVPSRNYFCKYVFRQDAIGAFANLKSKPNWNVEWAQNLEDEYKDIPEVTIDKLSVFVGHLDPRISREDLLERFEKHGKIKEAILVNRPLSNFAFIKFTTKEAAAAAVDSENHSMFKFKTIHVQYRELYNNFRRKYSNEGGNDENSMKLNLAPPPVNFKRHTPYHSKKPNYYNKNNQHLNNRKTSSYYNKNNNFFDNVNIDNPDKDDDNNIPKTFSQAMKMKHLYQPKGRFNFSSHPSNYSNSGNNKFNKIPNMNPLRKSHSSNSTKYPDSKSGNSEKSAGIDDVEILTGMNEVDTYDKNVEKNTFEKNIKDGNSLEQHDLDNDTVTVKSANIYGTAPKTSYTNTSVDNYEMDLNMRMQNQSSQPQYSYYYYYPTKHMPYMNNQRYPMMQNGTNMNNHPPQSSNIPYYYAPYSNYPPETPNTQMSHMYPPVYYYYNQMPMAENGDQQFFRNKEMTDESFHDN